MSQYLLLQRSHNELTALSVVQQSGDSVGGFMLRDGQSDAWGDVLVFHTVLFSQA